MNTPGGFDIKVMREFERDGKNECFEIRSGELRYAWRVGVEGKLPGLPQHARTAPETIAKPCPGPQGYGLCQDGLAGIISVRLPYAYDCLVVRGELL